MCNKKTLVNVLCCILGIVIFSLLLVGGSNLQFKIIKTTMFQVIGLEKNTTIRNLSYNKNSKIDPRVYLKEGDVFVPYLVLTSNYNGNTLLLREYLLPDTVPYKTNEQHMWSSDVYSGYYAESSIDAYLNSTFIDKLDPKLQEAIVDSEIIITDKSSLGVIGEKTEKIVRKVFLLSLTELLGNKMYTSADEGVQLQYFSDDYSRRVCNFSKDVPSSYWTRTPENWETYTVFTIGVKGVGVGAVDIESGVRPAFCINNSTAVTQRTDIISGKSVYVIDEG